VLFATVAVASKVVLFFFISLRVMSVRVGAVVDVDIAVRRRFVWLVAWR
jgi:hypothetical protein